MNELGDALHVAQRFGKILEGLQIPYYVGGSVASSIHGEPRHTNDIDICIQATPVQLEELIKALERDFIVDDVSMREEHRRTGSWNILDRETSTKVDIFFARADSLQRSEMARRQRVKLNNAGDTVFVASPEDMIIRKLLWFRKGNEVSERQWRDVVEMLRVGTNLDQKYLTQWADWTDITDLLTKARKEAIDPSDTRPR